MSRLQSRRGWIMTVPPN
uniref:Uncharacterized protein n=1 Tax=Anguilla anguilla TaxID=7936 RepID=A0A0E9PKU8_ANGAN